MAAFAENLIYRVPWGPPRVLALLHDWCRARVVLFANRDSNNAKAKGVPTEDLIRRFQRGQSRAFEALYDRFKDYVYRTAFFITRNSGDAEEAVQETFLDVLRALPNYRVEGPARFETWLYRVTVNRCRSRMRRKTLPSADWDDVEERLERIPASHPDHDPEGEPEERSENPPDHRCPPPPIRTAAAGCSTSTGGERSTRYAWSS